MDARWGWGLALLAVAGGAWQGGWRGALMGLSVVAFWLLLQFSRSLRVLQRASAAPVGSVPNAVMFQARLQAGMTLLQVLPLAGSLGRKLSDAPETFAWQDAAGDAVHVRLQQGRVQSWQLQRAEADAAA
jgi:hypothetical protein